MVKKISTFRSSISGMHNSFICSSVMGGMSSGFSAPFTRRMAGLPTWRCKSEPLMSIIALKSLLTGRSLVTETPKRICDFANDGAAGADPLMKHLNLLLKRERTASRKMK